MIRTDRKLKNSIIKVKPSMSDYMLYVPSENEIEIYKSSDIHKVIKTVPLKIDSNLVNDSIQRLIDAGYLTVSMPVHGGFFFSITSRFILRHEFAIESFSKKFWGGFFSGIVTSVIGGLLLLLIQGILGI